jgi:hypothetical protein
VSIRHPTPPAITLSFRCAAQSPAAGASYPDHGTNFTAISQENDYNNITKATATRDARTEKKTNATKKHCLLQHHNKD